MLKTYCLQANLEALLDGHDEIHDIIPEALEKLKVIDGEDHRGMFAETDLTAWSSTVFKSKHSVVTLAELHQISRWLSRIHSVPSSHWTGKVTSGVTEMEGIALGRVIFSPARIKLENSYVVVKEERRISGRAPFKAGQILRIFSHVYPHPKTTLTATETFVELSVLEPIDASGDLYRELQMGWLCKPEPLATEIVPLSHVVCHFVKTDLLIEGQTVMHVLPYPKVYAYLLFYLSV